MPTSTVETNAAQTPLEATRADLAVILGGAVKDGHACDKGDVLGVITSGGKLRRRSRSTVKTGGAFATDSDTGKIVDASKKFVAGDVLKVLTAVKQRETFTVIGTVDADGAGNVAVTVTGALIPGGSKVLNVAVANNDTAAQVAGKIRTALAADGDINDGYAVGGSGADGYLETLVEAAYDSTLNVAIAEGTSDGLTDAPTSTNTTLGNAAGATLGTVESINGDDVTLTGNASINAAVGAVVVGSDGSETAAGIAGLGADGEGDTSVPVYYGGYLNESALVGLDSSAKTELGGKTVAGGIFKF
jgi:hypothetical protein